MVKKIISVLTTFLIMMVLAVLSTTLILRSYLNIETISKVMESVSTNDKKDSMKSFDTLLDSAFEDLGLDGQVSDYIDKKELSKAIESYLTDYVAYLIGEGDMPTIDRPEVNNIMDKAINQFEKKTGEKIDKSDIKEVLSEVDEKVEKNGTIVDKVDSQTLNILKTIYIILASKVLIIVLIIILLVLIGIIALLNIPKITSTIAYVFSAFLINGVCIIICPIILSLLSQALGASQDLMNIITKPFYIHGAICVGISIALLVANIIIKVIQKKKAPQSTTQLVQPVAVEPQKVTEPVIPQTVEQPIPQPEQVQAPVETEDKDSEQ